MSERRSSLTRKTRETDIQLELNLDGTGLYEVATGIPFFDHMLESFTKHAAFDLRLRAKGDLEVDWHHTVEDVGIALGQALRQALGDARGIRRYGFFVLPMAESRVDVSLDVSNRAFLVYKVELANDRVRDFDVSLVEDFLKRMTFARFEPPKLRELGLEVIRLAELEGLTGHGTSVDLRLARIRRARREREAAREAGNEEDD